MKIVSKIFKNDKYYLTSPFGWRKDPITNKPVFHTGVDYGTSGKKAPQYAVEDGIVLSCGRATDGANYVWVNYPRIKKKFLHYHLDSVKVKNGQKVNENTILGYTGTTGYSTGIHLHLGMQDSSGSAWQDVEKYNYVPVNNKPSNEPPTLNGFVRFARPRKYVAKQNIIKRTSPNSVINTNIFGTWEKGVGITCVGYIDTPGYRWLAYVNVKGQWTYVTEALLKYAKGGRQTYEQYFYCSDVTK